MRSRKVTPLKITHAENCSHGILSSQKLTSSEAVPQKIYPLHSLEKFVHSKTSRKKVFSSRKLTSLKTVRLKLFPCHKKIIFLCNFFSFFESSNPLGYPPNKNLILLSEKCAATKNFDNSTFFFFIIFYLFVYLFIYLFCSLLVREVAAGVRSMSVFHPVRKKHRAFGQFKEQSW